MIGLQHFPSGVSTPMDNIKLLVEQGKFRPGSIGYNMTIVEMQRQYFMGEYYLETIKFCIVGNQYHYRYINCQGNSFDYIVDIIK